MGIHLQNQLHLSTAKLGLLISAAQLAPLVGLLVAGELLDRYDERWVVGAGACAVAVSLCAGSLAPGYGALLCVLLVVGAGYSTVQPGGSKSVASWFDASQRGFAMGIRQAGLPLGAALASAVLPYLALTLGWRSTLLTGGLVALLGSAVFMGFYHAAAHRDRGDRSRHCAGQYAARLAQVPTRHPATNAPRTIDGEDHAVRDDPDIGAVRGGHPDGAAPP